MTWNVVVDTVVFCRAIAASQREVGRGSTGDNFLEALCRAKVIRIVLDPTRALETEYGDTCNREVAIAAIYKLQSLNGVIDRVPKNKVPSPARGKLITLGFVDTIDKLVVRLGLAGLERDQPYICSEDSDFWDPADTSSPGDHSSVVCVVLESDLGLSLLSQSELVALS